MVSGVRAPGRGGQGGWLSLRGGPGCMAARRGCGGAGASGRGPPPVLILSHFCPRPFVCFGDLRPGASRALPLAVLNPNAEAAAVTVPRGPAADCGFRVCPRAFELQVGVRAGRSPRPRRHPAARPGSGSGSGSGWGPERKRQVRGTLEDEAWSSLPTRGTSRSPVSGGGLGGWGGPHPSAHARSMGGGAFPEPVGWSSDAPPRSPPGTLC